MDSNDSWERSKHGYTAYRAFAICTFRLRKEECGLNLDFPSLKTRYDTEVCLGPAHRYLETLIKGEPQIFSWTLSTKMLEMK